MAVHGRHDQVSDDGRDVLLHDGCDRCGEQAVEPLLLDDGRLRALWCRMLDVEFGDGPDWYTSGSEGRACRSLYRMAVLMQRLGVDPELPVLPQEVA